MALGTAMRTAVWISHQQWHVAGGIGFERMKWSVVAATGGAEGKWKRVRGRWGTFPASGLFSMIDNVT